MSVLAGRFSGGIDVFASLAVNWNHRSVDDDMMLCRLEMSMPSTKRGKTYSAIRARGPLRLAVADSLALSACDVCWPELALVNAMEPSEVLSLARVTEERVLLVETVSDAVSGPVSSPRLGYCLGRESDVRL